MATDAQPRDTPDRSGRGLLNDAHDPMLAQIREQVEAKVPAALKREYLAVVVAGQQVLYGKTSPMAINALRVAVRRLGPVRAVAYGTVRLIQIIGQEAKGQMHAAAAIPAAVVLSTYGWGLVESFTGQKTTKQQVSDSTLILVKGLLLLFGISEQRLAQGVEALRQGRGSGATAGPPLPPAAAPATGAPAATGPAGVPPAAPAAKGATATLAPARPPVAPVPRAPRPVRKSPVPTRRRLL